MFPDAVRFPVVALGAFLIFCGTLALGRSVGNRNLPHPVRQRQTLLRAVPGTPGLTLVVLGLLSAPPGQQITASTSLAGAVAAGVGAGLGLGRGSG